jgi:phenolic acid decarboxylase
MAYTGMPHTIFTVVMPNGEKVKMKIYIPKWIGQKPRVEIRHNLWAENWK